MNIAVLAKIVEHVVPSERKINHDNRMDALTEWQPDVDAVLSTLAGRKRWDVRGGWMDSKIHWPLYMRLTAASDRLDLMLRADECMQWIRKQMGFIS